MVELSAFYNLSIYNTEGKFIGKVTDVVLNIKKGRISFFKAKALTDDTRNVGLRDVLRNSMRLVPEEDEAALPHSEGIVDIPYEVVSAVNDIILIDQNKLSQYQQAIEQKASIKKAPVRTTQPQQVPKPN